jgi:hypothetical protein
MTAAISPRWWMPDKAYGVYQNAQITAEAATPRRTPMASISRGSIQPRQPISGLQQNLWVVSGSGS